MLIPTKFGDVSVLGAFSIALQSGNTVSLAAGAHLASLRWAPVSGPAQFLVLSRIKVGAVVQAAVTAATIMDMRAIIARGFSVDFTTNKTTATLAAPGDTNKMWTQLAGSAMTVNGPNIATTAAMSGQTLTLDANPFACTVFANQPSGNATVTQAIGVGFPMTTLYEWTGLGQHPVVLQANEGVIVQPLSAAVVTGAIQYYVQFEWSECSSVK